nr:gustatory receptor 4 [Pachyrhinus yasumatsui]
MEPEKIAPVIKKNWFKRTLTAVSLISYLGFVAYIGIPPVWLSTLFIQVKCFQEIINIAYNYKKVPEIPLFRTLNWYLLFVANYYLCGETLAQYLEPYTKKYSAVEGFFKYHRFLSFCWYIIGIVWFLNNIRKKDRRKQFSILAWVHFLCIIIVLQSYMIIQNLFEGLIWVILPVALVFVNDIFAYIFGTMYGKTPLINLSPSKTLEGFLGGGVSSVVLGTVLAWILCHFNHMVCPTKFVFVGERIKMTTECTRSYLFQPIPYSMGLFSITMYPFLLHVQMLALFASFIAPFGGFFASGFKRAVKMKDFGDTFPGHGGVMDRFDCQYLMATFVNVYIISFVRNFSVEKMFSKVLYLDESDQLEFYKLLEKSLMSQGRLDSI